MRWEDEYKWSENKDLEVEGYGLFKYTIQAFVLSGWMESPNALIRIVYKLADIHTEFIWSLTSDQGPEHNKNTWQSSTLN